MFNTVKEIHIAIDTYLQQLNSNRKQAFRPEQYDFLINSVLLQYIEDKIDPISNPKREGFEDNQRRVDELKDLKKSLTLRFYNNDNESKQTIIPSDYYKLIAGGCTVKNHYNKRTLTITPNTETKYIYNITFPNDTPSSQGVQIYKNARFLSTTFFDKTYSKPIYSTYGKFEIINYFLDYFRKDYGCDAYWEYYNGIYYPSQIILVTTTQITNVITLTYITGVDGTTVITNTASATTKSLTYNTTTGNIINAAIELISSKDKRESLNNYYISKNRQDQPICIISNDKLNIYYNNTFVPITIDFNYIIKPRLINYYFNIMPEIQINNEIILRVVDKLKIYVKDEQAYNQFANDVMKVQ